MFCVFLLILGQKVKIFKIQKIRVNAPPSSALRAGGLGVFAFRDVPSRRFAPSFVYFEVHVCIRWSRDPFSAWGASVSDVGKVVPRNSCHVIGNLLTEEGHHDT